MRTSRKGLQIYKNRKVGFMPRRQGIDDKYLRVRGQSTQRLVLRLKFSVLVQNMNAWWVDGTGRHSSSSLKMKRKHSSMHLNSCPQASLNALLEKSLYPAQALDTSTNNQWNMTKNRQ